MIPQEELESAIARWKARQGAETGGEGVPQPVAVPNSIDDESMEPSYPAMVEVADDGARTPVPARYGVPQEPEAHRSDSELRAVRGGGKAPPPYSKGAAIPRGNEEPTMVAGSVADYMPEMVDSGLVQIDGDDEDK